MSKTTKHTVCEVIGTILVLCVIAGLAVFAVYLAAGWTVDRSFAEIFIGLVVGSVLGCMMFAHMGMTIERSLEMGEKGATNRTRMFSVLRTLVVLGMMIGAYLSGWVNLLALVCGILLLKVAAYLQPFTHKCAIRFGWLEPDPVIPLVTEEEENIEEMEESDRKEEKL